MGTFNYQKGYCVLALPAFNNFNPNQKKAFDSLHPMVGDLGQDKNLNIPMSYDMENILSKLSDLEIAEISRASYFVGHWKPSLMDIPFDNKRGESWKIANICDQYLRKTIQTPHYIQIHQGKFRVTFENKRCWIWEEFGLVTFKNLEIFKGCGLRFGEETLHDSAKKLSRLTGDLWPDPDSMEDNNLYNNYLDRKRIMEIKKLNDRTKLKLKELERDIVLAKYKKEVYEYFIYLGLDIDNCIYYKHTNQFCFGWREKITEAEKDNILSKIGRSDINIEFETRGAK